MSMLRTQPSWAHTPVWGSLLLQTSLAQGRSPLSSYPLPWASLALPQALGFICPERNCSPSFHHQTGFLSADPYPSCPARPWG